MAEGCKGDPAFDAYADLCNAAPKLKEALEAVRDDVCSFLCPSTWKTSDGRPPHSEKCRAVSAALALAGEG